MTNENIRYTYGVEPETKEVCRLALIEACKLELATNFTWTEAYRAHRRQTWAIFWAFALGFLALLWALLKTVGL